MYISWIIQSPQRYKSHYFSPVLPTSGLISFSATPLSLAYCLNSASFLIHLLMASYFNNLLKLYIRIYSCRRYIKIWGNFHVHSHFVCFSYIRQTYSLSLSYIFMFAPLNKFTYALIFCLIWQGIISNNGALSMSHSHCCSLLFLLTFAPFIFLLHTHS